MLTLHSSGRRKMMERSHRCSQKRSRKKGTDNLLLLTVTILTSLKNDQLQEIGMPADTLSQVLRLAKLAREAGVDGIVCSPQEAFLKILNELRNS